MTATRSVEKRLLEMEKKEQASREKAKRYAAKKKALQQRQAEDERKKRTHRLCQVSGNAPSLRSAADRAAHL
ncbi:MAG: hypothetical protein LUG99_14965 [Lachnospiraceae bacterium]|nr:hypothetical protein [Lachnospiraceae bacterium]